MGTLYLVATPIGNLEDMSTRAVKTLKRVNLIAAEDTRRTRRLLAHFEISTPLISYHDHSKPAVIKKILSALEGGDVALVTDAGTPGINDPGFELVRAAIRVGKKVSPIPGPTAPIAALIASGLSTDTFLFLGYLPRKSRERRRFLADNAEQPHTLIFLETPHRILDSLQDLSIELGDRRIAVARELTKLHEEIFRGSISESLTHFETGETRGEFTLIVEGYTPSEEMWSVKQVREAIKVRLSKGESPTQVAKGIAQKSGWKRRQIYQLVIDMSD